MSRVKRAKATSKTDDAMKSVYTKIEENLYLEIEREAERRGYPWTFASVVRDALARGMSAINAEHTESPLRPLSGKV
jgi:hypothetical protein